MRRVKNNQGLTLIEVLIAAAILAVGLLALVSAFPIGYVDVTVSGGQSRATSYAQAMMEQLKNQPFPAALPVNGNDVPQITAGVPDAAYTRTWNVTQEPGTNPPNRLARVRVTVQWGGDRPQTVILESMRAE